MSLPLSESERDLINQAIAKLQQCIVALGPTLTTSKEALMVDALTNIHTALSGLMIPEDQPSRGSARKGTIGVAG